MVRITIALGALALVSGPAMAQTTLSGDHVVTGALTVNKFCAGVPCEDVETYGSFDAKIKSSFPYLSFEDSGGTSDRDWSIQANNNSSEFFAIRDETAGRSVVHIEPDAPSNGIYLSASGNLGLGTALPQADLHITSLGEAAIRFEPSTFSPQSWTLGAGDASMGFRIEPSGNIPFAVKANAPSLALVVADEGNVGLGTAFPAAQLELSSSDSFNFFRLTATGATVDSVDITYTNGPLSNGELRYNIVDGDGPEMRLDGDGKLTIVGQLVTAGSCSVGCDAVFKDDYALKSIEEHQAQMWAAGYLPNVGPTPEYGPFNVSDKMGRMLNELEHAHIYIGELHSDMTQIQNSLSTERARADRLEAQLAEVMERLSRNGLN